MTDNSPEATPLFIDEHVEVHEGDRAAAMIRERVTREAALFDPARGIARVGRERWEEAQRYERRSWMEKSRYAATDRNEYHRDHFASYTPLRGLTFERGIELGCGPFTNMRLLLEHCSVRHVSLLDPLLADYLAHPFCQYRGARLGGLAKDLPRRGALRRPLQVVRNRLDALAVGGVRGRPVELVTSKIETFTPSQRFDLVVMINVIEHCQDIDAVFGKVVELLAPGGIFIFADRLYDAESVRQLAAVLYDMGHPLRVDRGVVNGFLDQHFTPLMRAVYPVEEKFRDLRMQNEELYYIGRRLAGAGPCA